MKKHIFLLILIWGFFLLNHLPAETWFEGNPTMLAFKDNNGYLFSDSAQIEIFEGAIKLRAVPWGIFKDFSYRLPLRIKENSGKDLLDYNVVVWLDTAKLISLGKIKKDCSDIRFADSANAYAYWLESGCDTNRTKFWVKVPFIPAKQIQEIFIYYGSPLAKSMVNAEAVFEPVNAKNWAQGWKALQSSSCTGVSGWNGLGFDEHQWQDVPHADVDQWTTTHLPCEQCDWYMRKRFIALTDHTNNIIYTVEGSMRITVNGRTAAEKPLWECHGNGVDSGTVPIPIEPGEVVIGIQCSHGKGDKRCKISDLSNFKFLRVRKFAAIEPEITLGKEKNSKEPVGFSLVPQFVETPIFGEGKNISNWIKVRVSTSGKDKDEGSLKIFYKYSSDEGKIWNSEWLGGVKIHESSDLGGKENGQSFYLSEIPVNNNGKDRIKFKIELVSANGYGSGLEVKLLTLYYNDLEKPRVGEVKVISPFEIEVSFSEEVSGAEKAANYSVSGLEIKRVEKRSENVYHLNTVSPQTTSKEYVLTLQKIVDLANNPLDPNPSIRLFQGYDNPPAIESFSIQAMPRTEKDKGGVFYTNTRKLKVSLKASDSGGTITGYLLKEDNTAPVTPGDFAGKSALPPEYLLKGEEGPITVYAWVLDNTNNISQPASAGINLDLTPPRLNSLIRSLDPFTIEFSFNEIMDELAGIDDKNNYFLEPVLPIDKISLIGRGIYEPGDIVYRLQFKTPQDSLKNYSLKTANLMDLAGNVINLQHSGAGFKGWDNGLPVIEQISINGQIGSAHYLNKGKLDLKISARDQDGKIVRWLINTSCQRPESKLMEEKGFPSAIETFTLKEIEGEQHLCVWVMDGGANVNVLTASSMVNIFLDRTNPEISSINVVSNNQLDVIFNEKIISAEKEGFFNLDGTTIKNISAVDTQTFRLTLSGALGSGDHLINVKNITDLAGNPIKINRKAFGVYPPRLNVSGQSVSSYDKIISRGEENIVAIKISLSLPPESSYPLSINQLKVKSIGDIIDGNKVVLSVFTDNNSDGLLAREKLLGKGIYSNTARNFLVNFSSLIVNPGDTQDILLVLDLGKDLPADKKIKLGISQDSFEVNFPEKLSDFFPINSIEFLLK